ncbi:Na(+)/H(+) antiporter subunit B [Thermodesulfobacteriota bacterium B35]
MKSHHRHQRQHVPRLILLPLLAALAGGLGYVLLSLPTTSPGLAPMVNVHLQASGVSNPVTAVLLNFRGYDTLLEMGVLLLALTGVWSLAGKAPRQARPPDPVLELLARVLVPLMILVAGYLFWIGGQAPGGAFQAGSVLGAAGVLILLTGWQAGPPVDGPGLRTVLAAGLIVFVLTGLATMVSGRRFLEYPLPAAGMIILFIEAVATLSIGLTLAALFLGGRPAPPPEEQ